MIISMLYTEAITQIINARLKQPRVTASTICIIAKELSCPRVLTYLATHTLTNTMEITSQSNTYKNNAPMTSSQIIQSKVPVGAVILIDPPPLLSLQANPCQAPLRILQRYIEPLHSPSAYQRCILPISTPSIALRLWQRCYQEHQQAEGEGDGMSLMKTSILHLMKSCYPDPDTPSSQDTNNTSLQENNNEAAFVQDSTTTMTITTAVAPATIETTTMASTTATTTTTTTTDTRTDTSIQPEERIDEEKRPVKSTPYSSQMTQSNPARSSVKLGELILAEELRLLELDEYIGMMHTFTPSWHYRLLPS